MAAFRASVDRWGADVLEMDVHRTLDGKLVVIHDPTVDRTTDGSGAISKLPWTEIEPLDAGYRFVDLEGTHSFRGWGARIPLFEEVLDSFPGTRLNVDAKAPSVMADLIAMVLAHSAAHRVLLASEHDEGRADRLGYPGPTSATRNQIRTFYLLHRLPFGGFWSPRVDAFQVPFHWDGRQITTPRFVREAQRRNIPVHVWTVDDEESMRLLLSWGVDGIQSDRPDLLARVLHEETGRPLPT